MNRIQRLPPLLVDQIAAGEVIERPLSVVKELVENSLDAGAKSITVTLRAGGKELIAVTDDGQGIHPDDLALAIAVHATSKIHSLEELENITSLGFRGEALATIQAISEFKLTTRIAEQEAAYCLSSYGTGEALEIKQAVHPVGTTVEVKNLFFNTPARRKFLKSDATEFAKIDELLRRLALSRCDIRFTLSHNGRKIYFLPEALTQEDQLKRLRMLCGAALVTHSLSLDFTQASYQLRGWVVPALKLAEVAKIQYFYVNGRMVRDRIISHAIKHAYRDMVYGQQLPSFILFLTLPAMDVDVNVHPTKSEVRFHDSQRVHDFIFSALHKVLSHSAVKAIDHFDDKSYNNSHEQIAPTFSSTMEQINLYEQVLGPKPEGEEREQKKAWLSNPFGRPLAQLKDIFMLAENDEGLLIIDMHAAHERVLYEKLKLESRKQPLPTQLLLVPYQISLNVEEMAIFETYQDQWSALGLTIDRMGPQEVVIRAVPMVLSKADLKHFLHVLLKNLKVLGNVVDATQAIDQILVDIACHSAIQAGDVLSLPALTALLTEMAHTPRIDHCNHGRPTWQMISLKELNQRFLRGR